MANEKLPFVASHLPWFMFDLYNLQLISSPTIPLGNISDTKDIILAETPIPGLGFSPISTGGMGNRKISFTLPLVKRNNVVGNVMLLKQFDNLRYQSYGMNPANIFNQSRQFNPNPKVLFYWGTGSGVPLEWYVKKCDFSHTSAFVNRFGYTQYTDITFELWLDETSPLFRVEEIFRKLASIVGQVESAYDVAQTMKGDSGI